MLTVTVMLGTGLLDQAAAAPGLTAASSRGEADDAFGVAARRQKVISSISGLPEAPRTSLTTARGRVIVGVLADGEHATIVAPVRATAPTIDRGRMLQLLTTVAPTVKLDVALPARA